MELEGPSLVLLKKNSESGTMFPLPAARNIVRFGRSTECDVRIQRDSVSAVHCSLRKNNGRWYLHHESKSNKTLVNGADAGVAPVLLQHGDIFTISKRHFRFLDPSAKDSVVSAASPRKSPRKAGVVPLGISQTSRKPDVKRDEALAHSVPAKRGYKREPLVDVLSPYSSGNRPKRAAALGEPGVDEKDLFKQTKRLARLFNNNPQEGDPFSQSSDDEPPKSASKKTPVVKVASPPRTPSPPKSSKKKSKTPVASSGKKTERPESPVTPRSDKKKKAKTPTPAKAAAAVVEESPVTPKSDKKKKAKTPTPAKAAATVVVVEESSSSSSSSSSEEYVEKKHAAKLGTPRSAKRRSTSKKPVTDNRAKTTSKKGKGGSRASLSGTAIKRARAKETPSNTTNGTALKKAKPATISPSASSDDVVVAGEMAKFMLPTPVRVGIKSFAGFPKTPKQELMDDEFSRKLQDIVQSVLDLEDYGRKLHHTFDDVPKNVEYKAVVKQPMSIGLIREKVKSYQYKTADEFFADWNLLWTNTQMWIPAFSASFRDASAIFETVQRKFAELFPKVEDVIEVEPEVKETKKVNNKKKKSKKEEVEVEEEEEEEVVQNDKEVSEVSEQHQQESESSVAPAAAAAADIDKMPALLKLKAEKLRELCQQYGVDDSGTRTDMIGRLEKLKKSGKKGITKQKESEAPTTTSTTKTKAKKTTNSTETTKTKSNDNKKGGEITLEKLKEMDYAQLIKLRGDLKLPRDVRAKDKIIEQIKAHFGI